MGHRLAPLAALGCVALGVAASTLFACRSGNTNAESPQQQPDASADDAAQASAATAASSAPPAPPPVISSSMRASTTNKSTLADCRKLLDKALAKTAPAYSTVVQHHAACTRNDDCIPVARPNCYSACDSLGMNKKGEEDLRLTSNAIANACEPWREAGCGALMPAATCAARVASCEKGKCVGH